ncbi:MAG: amidase family protein [Pedobacter sp.]|nr:amidase family protein [Pedobacter sp.]
MMHAFVCLVRKTGVAVSVALAISALSGCNDDDKDVASTPTSPAAPTATFQYVEGTITDLQKDLASGALTCHQVVQGYLDRIQAYDFEAGGPELKSIVTVSSNALADADALDAKFKSTGKMSGPLHCVPVLPKDNIDTVDMPTTAGALALQSSRPDDDAYIIQKIRNAGGIIIGKANMDEFAFGFVGSASIRGQVKNAYDQSKGPGGSSSGTGAAISASLAMVGIGTDTGGSVRVPSAVEGLVGIRPSLRLVSQDGIIPLAPTQDTAGPMCRTVQDCALLLDAMVGFDSSSHSNQRISFERKAALIRSATEYNRLTRTPASYTSYLEKDGLKGARIGVVRALFGTNANVIAAMEAAIQQMKDAGATVEDVTIPDLSTVTSYSSVSSYEFKNSLTAYLSSWSNALDGHFLTFDEVKASGLYESRNTSSFNSYGTNGTNPEANATYIKNTDERNPYARARITRALDNVDAAGLPLGEPYDVLLYPGILGTAPNIGSSPSTGNNNRLSPFTGYPAMAIPAGMVEPVVGQPKLPVGMEMLAREFDEPTLIRIGYAWQEYAKPRQAPTFTPELAKK